MMKKIVLIIFLLSANILAQSWYVIDPTSIDGTPDFSDVSFTDDNTGWISSSSQANIFKTDNGAVSFTTQSTSLGTSTEAIYMIDASTGFCGGGSGFVYNTLDGGANWGFLGTMATTLIDMEFVNANQGYACGNGGAVFSIAGGVTNLNSGLSTTLYGISAPSVDNVWVCGGANISYYNGSTFIFQAGPLGTYNSIFFINDQEGWVVGNNGLIGHTENGGDNWTQQICPSSDSFYDVFFLNQNEGWAVGAQGTILQTTNGGDTWNTVGAGLTTSFLRGVHFTSPTNGYVVGNGKTLIKYGLPLATKDDESVPRSFSLAQNYPNPFNPSTNIEFNLTEGSKVILTIYDLVGNKVRTLANGYQEAGLQSVTWDSKDNFDNVVAGGIYLYTIKAGNYTETKKMLLMK